MREPRNLQRASTRPDIRISQGTEPTTRSRHLLHKGQDGQRREMTRTVVVAADLLLILALGVHDDLGQHLCEDVVEELGGEDHLCPIVTGFENVEDIACTGDATMLSMTRRQNEQGYVPLNSTLSSGESVVEDLHWDLLLAKTLCVELRVRCTPRYYGRAAGPSGSCADRTNS